MLLQNLVKMNHGNVSNNLFLFENKHLKDKYMFIATAGNAKNYTQVISKQIYGLICNTALCSLVSRSGECFGIFVNMFW